MELPLGLSAPAPTPQGLRHGAGRPSGTAAEYREACRPNEQGAVEAALRSSSPPSLLPAGQGGLNAYSVAYPGRGGPTFRFPRARPIGGTPRATRHGVGGGAAGEQHAASGEPLPRGYSLGAACSQATATRRGG
jgi:hypothetical protein